MSLAAGGPMFRIPDWVIDLASFRRWMETDEFPEEGRLSYLNGELRLDMSMESALHNKAKTRFCGSIGNLTDTEQLGHVFLDGMRLTHIEADLSVEPDLIFATNDAFERQRVQFIKGEDSLELVGSPEMVLEVVSDSSEVKDTRVLPDLYWKASIREYWLVDPRGKELKFGLYRRGSRGFMLTKKKDGWVRSQVFGKEFRLTLQETALGLPEFTLDVR